jgi:DNA-binding NarL/FixJ family response regulator
VRAPVQQTDEHLSHYATADGTESLATVVLGLLEDVVADAIAVGASPASSVRGARRYGWRVAIRVVVAEDSLLVREGLRQLLAASPRVELVAACGDLDELLEAIERGRPDVVLTDIRMPPTNAEEGIQLAAQLRESHPSTGVVVLSQYSDPTYVLSLLEAGSDRRGYLLKDRVHASGQLVSAIDTVARGGSVIDPKIVEILVAAKGRAQRSPLSELTPREREVLAQIAEGKSNTAIAESLVLTRRAVEKHINSIFLKLGLASAMDTSKRVKATLLFLAETDGDPPDGAES